MNILKKLSKICSCKKNQNLKNYCSIKIGGNASFVCYPKKIEQLKKLIGFLNAKKIKYFVLGNGTNVVFEDCGFNGVIICLKKLNKTYVKKDKLVAYAGASLFCVNKVCAKYGLGGLEFLYGIPGSVGGACTMNAGAFGGEIKDVVDYVLVLNGNRICKLTNYQLKFGYRSSVVLHSKLIVLKVVFKLTKQNCSQVVVNQNQFWQKRIELQPYGTLNAGSVFKKTSGESAGKCIDKLGLKGVKIGQIQISRKHANFFVNLGEATSNDLHCAIDMVKQKVCNQYGILLQEEIIFVGG